MPFSFFEKNILRGALIISILLCSSCGWHLRGSASTNANYPDAIYYVSYDDYADISRIFSKTLQRKQIKTDLSLKQPRIELMRESIQSSTASLNALLDPAEKQIHYRLYYRLNGNDNSVQFYRTYQNNKNRAAARDNEKKILTKEMRQAAAESIINRMLQSL